MILIGWVEIYMEASQMKGRIIILESAWAFGLMLNSVLLGTTSLLMEILCRKLGSGVVWGISNIMMSLCFVLMIIISYIANNMDKVGDNLPPNGVVAAAVVVFAILGIPLAITYSVPYALISTRIESLGLGQGLSMGVLNLAIVIPQIVVSLGSGPLDQLFGGLLSPGATNEVMVSIRIGPFGVGLISPETTNESNNNNSVVL
ncbi:Sucrose transport protein SUT2 [Camellia lanceoleosa]|uniref:Sucrose transport protein SUT2 n=1 Tax=Camellia lanceoleosa TaxID=1840588 RepID=A0ACC0HN63_9ERIC|nr:Sucrose transport protein SUT2 [Camellia lanceoleosa]